MNNTDPAAPLATLEDTIGKPVTVRTKAGEFIQGILAGYDEHLNLTLEATPTDDHEDDEPNLIRGDRVVSITHPPIERENSVDDSGAAPDSDEYEPSTRTADSSDTKPSPALAELKAQLESKSLTVDVDAAGETLIVTKLGQEYRIHPDGTVEGEGLHRTHLEQFFTN